MKALALSLLAAVLGAATFTGASASQSVTQAIASHEYLVGAWDCTFTVGKRSGTYTSTWAKALDGRWLMQHIVQAPFKRSMMTGSSDPAAGGFVADYFVGFKETAQHWVRFGAMSTGQFFTISMTDDGAGGWRWKYLILFPPRYATRATADATFTKRSATRYTIDGPTYPEGNTTVTEHHICNRRG
jgi:hypothetical protein